MSESLDLLDVVVSELMRREGDLAGVARDAGMSYDTVLRIRRRENDPGYSKVRRLAEVLGIRLIAASDCVPQAQAGHGQ